MSRQVRRNLTAQPHAVGEEALCEDVAALLHMEHFG
jgi:hypothetical protein